MKPYFALKSVFGMLAFMLVLFVSSQQELSAQPTGEVVNLGLYGGASIDLTYCNTNNRLFGAVRTPGSVFYTDDDGATWTQPFPVDSLEFDNAQRGWGGGGVRVLANQSGWVAVRTAQSGGTLTSAVISFSEGDSGTFKTAMDHVMLQQIDPAFNAMSVSGIGLSDHYLFVGLRQYLVRLNDTSTYGLHNVVGRTDTISGIGTDYIIQDMAVANSVSGYPVYFVASASTLDGGNLFKFDGVGFTQIATYPFYPFPHTVERIFTHPAQITGDTLVASIRDTFSGTKKILLSLDAGLTWTDITPVSGSNWPLHSADYSASWVASMPLSNGLRLSFPGGGVSDDLGANWTSHVLPDNAMATHPTIVTKVAGSYGRGVAFSTSGAEGPFALAVNEGLAAVSISKIAQSKGVFYVSTNAGLGYTKEYFSSTIVGVDKWIAPHGEFPVAGVGDDNGVSAVAINPNDSLHVIAGHANGFSVSFSGIGGFSTVTPAGWNTSTNHDIRVTDLKFVSEEVVLAVTGTGSNVLPFPLSTYGNIWRSADGGLNWTLVTPSGFEQGNVVEVGVANGDTVVYAGAGYFDLNYPKVDGQLWRSDDKGVSWTFVNDGPTGVAAASPKMTIYDIDLDPRSNDTLYIASGENLDFALVRSTDGGLTYLNTPVVPHGAFSSVLVNRTNPDVVSAGARRNVFRYNTLTGRVDTTFFGLPGEFVPDLENGSTLLGTTTGFYKLVEDFGADTTVWNGSGNWSEFANWSNGEPRYLMNAVIQSGLAVVDDGFEVNETIVDPGASMTLANDGQLSLNNRLYLKSDETGSASFINVHNHGQLNAHAESYLSSGQWHYVSPLVQNATAAVFFFEETNTWIKYYDEGANDWVYINDTATLLQVGKGYAVWLNSSKSAEKAAYDGILNNQNFVYPLSFSGSSNGWNLIGNPFPSAIDWDEGDFNLQNNAGIAYVYDHGSYLSRNTIGMGTLTDGVIPAGQGFFIQALDAGASITLNKEAQVHNHQDFYKETDSYFNALDITLTGNGYKDKTWLGFDQGATAEFDLGMDALRLNGIDEAPKIFSTVGETPLSINLLPIFEQADTVFLSVEVPVEGAYTLSFDLTESFDNTQIVLTDMETSTVTDLNQTQQYFFDGVPGPAQERFQLVFNRTATQLPEGNARENLPRIYMTKDQICIEWTHEQVGTFFTMDIYGSDGRLLQQNSMTANSRNLVSVKEVVSGLLVVRLTTENLSGVYKLIRY